LLGAPIYDVCENFSLGGFGGSRTGRRHHGKRRARACFDDDFVLTDDDVVDEILQVDPTPDLAGEAPDGKYVYLSLRGPLPLSGDPHASTGSTPGLLVLEILKDGRDVAVRGLAPISNIDAGGVERADGHGIRVRRVNCAD
jgi:hypothetical protein